MEVATYTVWLSTELLWTFCGTEVFVYWTVVRLLLGRCVCELDCGVLAVGQVCL
jgi:hypothetical protein